MTSPIIAAHQLYKAYDAKIVLRGADLSVEPGQIIALVGENGAGKTTLLEILMGLRPASGGRATVFGFDVSQDHPEMRRRIGFLSETVPLYDDATVGETLSFHSAFFPSWDNVYAHTLRERLQLNTDTRYGDLSRGQKLRIGLVCALAHHPELFIFDEVMAGMDPLVRSDLVELIRAEQQTTGATVLFATNLLTQVQGFATHVAVVADGQVHGPESIDPTVEDLEAWFVARYRKARDE